MRANDKALLRPEVDMLPQNPGFFFPYAEHVFVSHRVPIRVVKDAVKESRRPQNIFAISLFCRSVTNAVFPYIKPLKAF